MSCLTSSCIAKMRGVDPRLVSVMKRAAEITDIPFRITEGLRTKERQRYLVKTGKSKTLNSKHIIGKAVDVAAYPGGKLSWNLADYRRINTAVQKAAREKGVQVTWGGTWKSIVDGPHFEVA